MGTRAADAIFDHLNGEPTVIDLQQEKGPDMVALPVEQRGPVTTQALPTQDGTTFFRTFTEGIPRSPIGVDLRRAKLTIMSSAGAFWYGFDTGSVQNRSAGWWPALQPLIITAPKELWIMEDTIPAVVSGLAEFWTG